LVDVAVVIILVSYFICLVSIATLFILVIFLFSSFAAQKSSHFATVVAAGSSFSTEEVYLYMECQNGKQY